VRTRGNFVKKRGSKEEMLAVRESTDEGLRNEKMQGGRRNARAVLVQNGGRGEAALVELAMACGRAAQGQWRQSVRGRDGCGVRSEMGGKESAVKMSERERETSASVSLSEGNTTFNDSSIENRLCSHTNSKLRCILPKLSLKICIFKKKIMKLQSSRLLQLIFKGSRKLRILY